jgi:hypothetical protein
MNRFPWWCAAALSFVGYYGRLHALVTRGSSIDVRVFPDDRPAIAQWLDAPVELIAVDSTSSSMP